MTTREDEQMLKAMMNQINIATENAQNKIDETLLFVAESNKQIARMEIAAKPLDNK